MQKIYKLICNSEVVYIGRTKMTLSRRKSAAYKSNPALQAIYKECEIVLIEETNDLNREQFWIDYYGMENLLNVKKGAPVDENDFIVRRKQWSRKHHYKTYEQIKDEKNKRRRALYQLKKDEINRKRREKNKSNA